MIFLWSCFSESISESLVIDGEQRRGWVEAEGQQANVFVESSKVATRGAVSAEVTREGGVTHVYFELETGGGPAQAFLRIEGGEGFLWGPEQENLISLVQWSVRICLKRTSSLNCRQF